ncbi:hypothetical protein ACVW0I_001135 [Bradyrhizobium sp. LM6.11]
MNEQDDENEDCDLAEHGAGDRLQEFVGDAEREGADQRAPQRLPTPPNTTTMKLSMM